MEKLEQLIVYAVEEFATEGIQILDARGTYIFCNKAFTSMTGLPLEARLGHNVLEVQPHGAAAKVFKSGLPAYGVVSSSREGVVMVSNASPIREENGEMIGIITIFNDQTSYMKLAQRLKERDTEMTQLKNKLRQLERPSYSFQDLIGEDTRFLECIRQAKRAAESDASVLLTGESGTGKELFAHAIHSHSLRSDKPFIRVNCPAIPSSLLESELFGYEKGAFTGASREKKGKFELAQGGSIFLDEIGDLDFSLQAKLLRTLQEKEVERVGSTRTMALDVRIIAATNQNLQEQIRMKQFRQDLYYRLNVIHLEVPPLRDRKGDIPLLLNHFLKKHTMGAVPCSISREALNLLTGYNWPGNVRELENVTERLLLYREGTVVSGDDVAHVLGVRGDMAVYPAGDIVPLAKLEEQAIKQALERCGPSLEGKRRAAAELGISLSGLYKKLRQYELRDKGN